MTKRIHFFATRTDLEPVMRAVEQVVSLTYVATGPYVKGPQSIVLFKSVFDIPEYVTSEASKTGDGYMIVERGSTIHLEKLNPYEGQEGCAVYPGFNPNSIHIRFGGILDDQVMIPGIIDTLYDDKLAQKYMRLFKSNFKKYCSSTNGVYHIGTEAYEWLMAGKRLAAAPHTREFDVRLSDIKKS